MKQILLLLLSTKIYEVVCNTSLLGLHRSLLSDLHDSASRCFSPGNDGNSAKVRSAMESFDGEGIEVWGLFQALSSSPTFTSKFWQGNPFLIRSRQISEIMEKQNNSHREGFNNNQKKNWIEGAFTVDKDLILVDNSYISGFKTEDILRKGIKTDTWAFRPIKNDPKRPTTWEEVSDALKGGTIYFNNAGSLWPNLGSLCRLASYTFGVPSNVNIYVTPPKSRISVPPHTDRQDVFVLQTEGSKRWRVYSPPKRIKGVDPLGRGKAGDIIDAEALGKPILDVVVRTGDLLFIPAGFPHTTDTVTVVENETISNYENEPIFSSNSVHLTLGLDTHVWALSYAHIRWSLLQRCGKDWKLDIQNDTAYWESMKFDIGFLKAESLDTMVEKVKHVSCSRKYFTVFYICCKMNLIHTNHTLSFTLILLVHIFSCWFFFKKLLHQLEPERWDTESLPTDTDISEVVEYLLNDHLGSLLEIQEEMYSNVDPRDDNTIIKGFQCSQKQNGVMQRYASFSKNESMSKAFEKRSHERDLKVSGSETSTQ